MATSALRSSSSTSPVRSAVGGRDAHRGPHEDLLALQGERLLEHLHDALGHVGRLHAFLAVLQQDRELVAAEAGGGVGRTQTALEPLAHLVQQPVACRVTEGVVDRLEVVEVHEQDRDRLVLPHLTLQGVRDTVVEQRPVREGRHGIVEGLVGELLLELLALGDVTGVQHDAAHVRVVQQRRAQRLACAQ